MQKNPQIVELNFVQNFKRIIIKDKQKTEEVSKILKRMAGEKNVRQGFNGSCPRDIPN